MSGAMRLAEDSERREGRGTAWRREAAGSVHLNKADEKSSELQLPPQNSYILKGFCV